ncbi:unnamed protein product, partial [Polarella glacialis]
DPRRFAAADLEAWLAAPEVCDLRKLFPVSVDREMWSLAAMAGGIGQLSFPDARSQVRLVAAQCSLMQELSVAAFAEAQQAAQKCAEQAGDADSNSNSNNNDNNKDNNDDNSNNKERSAETCVRRTAGQAAGRLLERWRDNNNNNHNDKEQAPSTFDEVRDFSGNGTRRFSEAYARRAEAALLGAAGGEEGGVLALPLGASVAVSLAGLAMELGRLARLLVEHVRTLWGIRNVMTEISAVYPTIFEQLPVFRVHSDTYGRHWDVLERLLLGLAETDDTGSSKQLRMAELGVACGPIGFHLLQRFPSLQYFGADPTIRDELRAAYEPFNARSKLFETTGEEMHRQLAAEAPMDFVFVDGPHTYSNVRNDLRLWESRVRSGGIIAGHAVIEHRLASGGQDINIGMDGTWRVQPQKRTMGMEVSPTGDPRRFAAADLEAWLAAPEVCDLRKLFPVSVDREMWSLAAMAGGIGQLSFPDARSQVRLVAAQCSLMQELSVAAFAEAQQAAQKCAEQAGDADSNSNSNNNDNNKDNNDDNSNNKERSAETCVRRTAGQAAGRLLERWRDNNNNNHNDKEQAPSTFDEVRDFSGNGTRRFSEAYARRAEAALVGAAGGEEGGVLALPLGASVAASLAGLAMELGRLARLLVEHVRTLWGIRNVMTEISAVYPTILEQLPVFRVHTDTYGRHWDVLERLLLGLAETDDTGSSKQLRMAELGVACGPIGFHLLQRFPSLQYFGADPTIRDELRAAYEPFNARSKLFETTGEEMHRQLAAEAPMDFVFVDGPHTYSNVRNDLRLWESRVRSGGIIAGHDFTLRHPPLLWAVIEHRLASGGQDINIGMDGTWWWQV